MKGYLGDWKKKIATAIYMAVQSFQHTYLDVLNFPLWSKGWRWHDENNANSNGYFTHPG